eukprot:m.22437 g.22437  ORF g.22437 m.22437 type:complete len:261 (+) comp6818_c0_seq1:648-1430(+)
MAATRVGSFLGRASSLAPSVRAYSPALRAAPAAAQANTSAPVPTASSRASTVGVQSIVSSPFAAVQVRHAHIDVPDFSSYKRQAPANKEEGDYSRRAFTYAMGAGGAVVGAHAAKNIVQDFLATMSASADVLALAKIEVDLTKIPEGKNVCLKWQGKPLFVRHRGSEEVAEVRGTPMADLKHQEKDEDRTQKPDWLVVLGICTHLGCVPLANAGDYGGYFCPCHGSHYDASGRIRKGPAPMNLEIPPYTFIEDGDKLVVG